MTLFWIFAFVFALCTAAVVVFPFWRKPAGNEENLLALNRRVFHERLAELEKDQAEGRIDLTTLGDLRTELERNLLALDAGSAVAPSAPSRRIAAWLVLVLVPALSLFFYYAAVAPQGLASWWALQKDMGPTVDRMLQGQAPTEEESAGHTLADFVRVLQGRLQANPENAEGWFMLGMSYVQMDMAQPAQQSFERAWRLDPAQTRYELAYAQTRIFSSDGQLDALSRKLLLDVLQKQPKHEGALLLLGLGAYRSGDYVTAVDTLEKLRAERLARNATGGPAAMQQLEETLTAARAQLQHAASGQVAAKTAGVIRVKITLDRTLAGKFQPGDVLYVFARALKGPPMPLAVVRRTAADIPLSIELDDSQSMMPSHLLSSEPEIVITARISRHGSPDPRPGDLEAVAVPLRQNGQPQSVELLISNVRP